MTVVIGREAGPDAGPTAALGAYRALDGSAGADLAVDLDRPHAALIVGKRGYGKSYTMGVLAEGLGRAPGLAPVVVDPMDAFGTMAEPAAGRPVPATVHERPRVGAAALDPRSWCEVLSLSPASGPGSLVWQAAGAATNLEAMIAHVEAADAPDADRRAARNHLELAGTWGVFAPDGLDAAALCSGEVTVLDVGGLDRAPMNAVVRGVAETLYRARVEDAVDRLPWLLVDEAHAFFDGVARPAIERILTRGRAPGVSLALATQRPSAVSDVGVSQTDLLVAHRLTSAADLAALEAAAPTYLDGTIEERLPAGTGEGVVVDDATESVHAVAVRERDTPHGGGSPRASAVAIARGDGDHTDAGVGGLE